VPARDLTGNIVSDSSDDKPTTKYVRTKEAKARQALRMAELTREGYTVVQGGSGLTVFNMRQDAASARNESGTFAVNIITEGE
jgi:hypothetical protein